MYQNIKQARLIWVRVLRAQLRISINALQMVGPGPRGARSPHRPQNKARDLAPWQPADLRYYSAKIGSTTKILPTNPRFNTTPRFYSLCRPNWTLTSFSGAPSGTRAAGAGGQLWLSFILAIARNVWSPVGKYQNAFDDFDVVTRRGVASAQCVSISLEHWAMQQPE